MSSRTSSVGLSVTMIALAVAGVAIAAQDWVDQVAEQLDGIRAEIAAEFAASSDVGIGELQDGGEGEFTVQVEAGVEYVIIGVCDVDCADLDMAAWNEDGDEIASDIEPDDYPVLRFQAEADGEVYVGVLMADCAADTCVWGVQGFAR